MSITRNQFLKLLGLSATASLGTFSGFSAGQKESASQSASGLKLGLASYTLRKFSLDEANTALEDLKAGKIIGRAVINP